MGRIYIAIRPELRDRLLNLARKERRRPADQAALILERALSRAEPPRKEDREEISEVKG